MYKVLSRNQVCILPDPRIVCSDGLPMFQIFTTDFKEKKIYKKYKNAYASNAADSKSNGCEFINEMVQCELKKMKVRDPSL